MITNLEIIGIKFYKINSYYQLIWHNGTATSYCFINSDEAKELLRLNANEITLDNHNTTHYSFKK